MRVLITGGAGFIGSHLSEELLKRGDEVTIIDDLSTGSLENIEHLRGNQNFHFVIETIMNETVMDRLVSECDMIYHLAAAVGVELIITNPVEVIQRNILGSEIVFRIASRYKKKVLTTSTSEIYGKNGNAPLREDDDRILGPTSKNRWCYSCSKAADEYLALAYCKQKGLPVVIVRLFNTIGPRQTGQYGMVVPRFVQQALKNEPITVYGDGNQSRCFIYVTDVVDTMIALANQPKAVGEIYNIGSDEEITISDLARKVKLLTNSKSDIIYIPYDEAYEAGFEDMRRRVPDITKIRELIGYSPRVSLDTMIKEVAGFLTNKVEHEKQGASEWL